MIDALKLLFGIKTDPTRDWPQLAPGAPLLDLRTMRVGPLAFWEPIAKAKELGRPDVCQRVVGKVDELVYARAGYLLEFYRGRFSYIAYLIGDDGYEDVGQEDDRMVFSQPRVLLPSGETVTLSPEANLETLVAWLGKPESADVDDEESVVLWRKEGVTIEAELDARGRLKRFNLYPTAS